MNITGLRQKLEKFIEESIAKGDGNRSPFKDLATGRDYQTINLISKTLPGFRDLSRFSSLDKINFEGKTVLDIGSNFGEVSRWARAKGASYVEGIEFDPYFVTIANLVNALHCTDRVTFRVADATNPAVYDREFDIVLCMSAYNYAAQVLDRLREITKEYFVVETHKAIPGILDRYTNEISPYFKYVKMLGCSDWGRGLDGERYVLLFKRKGFRVVGLA